MDAKKSVNLEHQQRRYLVHYDIADQKQGWFQLTIYCRGLSLTERVPCDGMSPEDSVRAIHAPRMLAQLLAGEKSGQRS